MRDLVSGSCLLALFMLVLFVVRRVVYMRLVLLCLAFVF